MIDTHKELKWVEDLPTDCPPANASRPSNDQYFRFVSSIPPSDKDFWSHRKLFPTKSFFANECKALSCSVISNLDACKRLRKFPRLKNRRIVELILTPDSGVVEKTGKEQFHYSWWRVEGFDPIKNCKEVI